MEVCRYDFKNGKNVTVHELDTMYTAWCVKTFIVAPVVKWLAFIKLMCQLSVKHHNTPEPHVTRIIIHVEHVQTGKSIKL